MEVEGGGVIFAFLTSHSLSLNSRANPDDKLPCLGRFSSVLHCGVQWGVFSAGSVKRRQYIEIGEATYGSIEITVPPDTLRVAW